MEQASNKVASSENSNFKLAITDDKLSIVLSCGTNCINDPQFHADLTMELQKMGVKPKPNLQLLESAAKEAIESGKNVIEMQIVNGTQPVMPVDGRIEWQGDFFSEKYYVDPNTNLTDFHQKVGVPAVEKDQLLVKIISAKEGSAGIDVIGKPIKVDKPQMPKIRPGPNVVWDEKEGGFRAKCSGRIKFQGEMLDVENIFRINGNVNIDTGNIKHNGPLIILGDIESGFKVETTGDIDVKGIVYSAEITCEGKLTAKEGINENIEKKINTKGGVSAQYILHANIESEDSICAQKEIFQSKLRTRRTVDCRDGRILGGEIMAAKGIIVGEAGSKADVVTTLVAGVDYWLQEKNKANSDTITQLQANLKGLNAVRIKLKDSYRLLSAAQKETLRKIGLHITESQKAIHLCEEENSSILLEIHEGKNACIVIGNMVYPGVILRICDAQYAIKEVLMGPITALYDKATGKIVLSSEFKNLEK